MGFIREQFGRITIESRRESFMIHVEDASLREPSSEWWTSDLDDLIAALVDYRASLGPVSGGGNGVDTPPPNPSPDDTTRYARRGFGIASGAPPVMSNMRAPEPEGDNPAITPPSNPYPFHEPLRVEHHSDEDKRQAWDEGYAAGVVAGRSIPSTGTGWDRGYAAGLAARDTRIAALDDLVQRAWRLIAGAMSGNPHKPTANSDWMDSAHAWEIDYCMGQGSAGGGGVVSAVDAAAPHQREPGEAPDTPGTCRAPHCWSEYGTPCATCPKEKR